MKYNYNHFNIIKYCKRYFKVLPFSIYLCIVFSPLSYPQQEVTANAKVEKPGESAESSPNANSSNRKNEAVRLYLDKYAVKDKTLYELDVQAGKEVLSSKNESLPDANAHKEKDKTPSVANSSDAKNKQLPAADKPGEKDKLPTDAKASQPDDLKENEPAASGDNSLQSLFDYYEKPLLKKGRFLLRQEWDYFKNEESYERHPDSSSADINLHLNSLANEIAFSPWQGWEFALGYRGFLQSRFKEFDYLGSIPTTVSNYDTGYFQDYMFKAKMRRERIEFYLDVNEKRQKSKINYSDLRVPTRNIGYVTKTNYEDFKVGGSFISANAAKAKTNLAKIETPILSNGEYILGGELGYKKGKLFTFADYSGFTVNYLETNEEVRPKITPQINYKYGYGDILELDTGLLFSFPYKLNYSYEVVLDSAQNSITKSTYKLQNDLIMPLNLRFRPADAVEFQLSSDYKYAYQQLDYEVKNYDNTITTYPTKKLNYHNIKPTLKIMYLYDNGKEIEEDEFSSITKDILRKGQWLLEFEYQKDITMLNKNSANGPQNIIDPFSNYQFPMATQHFGTEYYSIISGNHPYYAYNILPQNFDFLSAGISYGLFDTVELKLSPGYRFESSLKHFVFPNLYSSFYRFRPFFFLDTSLDWRIRKNCLISFKSHYVPSYRIELQTTNVTSNYTYDTCSRYLETELSVEWLF